MRNYKPNSHSCPIFRHSREVGNPIKKTQIPIRILHIKPLNFTALVMRQTIMDSRLRGNDGERAWA